MQNDRQSCKIKVRKFLFDILWCFGVMEEKPEGVGSAPPPPGQDRVKKEYKTEFLELFSQFLDCGCA